MQEPVVKMLSTVLSSTVALLLELLVLLHSSPLDTKSTLLPHPLV